MATGHSGAATFHMPVESTTLGTEGAGLCTQTCLFCSTDLMTEMTDLTSDLLGSGIPFLDYKVYAERVFFPGHQESPLHRDLGVPESRRPTVEQGLGQEGVGRCSGCQASGRPDGSASEPWCLMTLCSDMAINIREEGDLG